MNTAAAVAVSIPTTLLIMSSVAGATAQVTNADRQAVQRAMLYFGTAMLIAALLSQNLAVATATGLSLGAAYYGLQHAWSGSL